MNEGPHSWLRGYCSNYFFLSTYPSPFQVMLGGKNVEDGFGIAFRVLQVWLLDHSRLYQRQSVLWENIPQKADLLVHRDEIKEVAIQNLVKFRTPGHFAKSQGTNSLKLSKKYLQPGPEQFPTAVSLQSLCATPQGGRGGGQGDLLGGRRSHWQEGLPLHPVCPEVHFLLLEIRGPRCGCGAGAEAGAGHWNHGHVPPDDPPPHNSQQTP